MNSISKQSKAMISSIYEALARALESIEDDGGRLIRHVDLWNRNVEFIEDEQPWPRPAVFIEFGEVSWSQYNGASRGFTGECPVTLHVVTDWKGSTAVGSPQRDEAVAMLDLSETICRAVQGLSGDGFRNMRLRSSIPNHDHEEIVESIERYAVTLDRKMG